MLEQRAGPQMPDGTTRFVSASRQRCCSWILVGCGSVLLLIGVILFVYGLSPSGQTAVWSEMKWLGVACGVIGLMLLIGSVVLYFNATGTKDARKYPVERVHSKRQSHHRKSTSNNRRQESVNRRQESVNGRQESVNGRQESVNGRQECVNGRQESVNSTQESVNGCQESVSGRQESVNRRQESVNGRLPGDSVVRPPPGGLR